jgi:hypothetical protein
MEICYIARRNAITEPELVRLETELIKFKKLRIVFVELGVRSAISLPRQHALSHYSRGIRLFGSPNGLCSSITESKHIKAVKEPWRRSSRFEALYQMLRTICRMESLAALSTALKHEGLLDGSTTNYARQAQEALFLSAQLDATHGDRIEGRSISGDEVTDQEFRPDDCNSQSLPLGSRTNDSYPNNQEEEAVQDDDTPPFGEDAITCLSSVHLARTPRKLFLLWVSI